MKIFKVSEIRINKDGEKFVVESTYKAPSEPFLRKFLNNSDTIVDRNFRIKEVIDDQKSNTSILEPQAKIEC